MFRPIKQAKTLYIKSLSNERFAAHFTRRHLKKIGASLDFMPQGGFRLTEDKEELIIPRRSRLHYYRKGLKDRLAFLKMEYLGSIDVQFEPNDIIIDCGSNIGEFIRSLNVDASHRIFAFEPDPIEHQALQVNIGAYAEVVHMALWNEHSDLEIFLGNDTGDSGVFQTNKNQKSIKVPACPIESYIKKVAPDGVVRLLKIEAEGVEPEVLSGARGLLTRTHFLAIDVGPERGSDKMSPLISVLEILEEFNFKMVNFNCKRITCLFENQNHVNGS